MAITYDGALYAGPDADVNRYMEAPMPSTPIGDFSIFFIVQVPFMFTGTDPQIAGTDPVSLFQNFLAGAGGSGIFAKHIPGNASTNPGKLQFLVRSGGVYWGTTTTTVTGTTSFAAGDTFVIVLQSNAGVVQVKTCLKGSSTVNTELSETRNASFGARALGSFYLGRSSSATTSYGTPNLWQALGMGSKALTDANIVSLAAGGDPETIYAAGERTRLWLLNSTTATITDVWGATAMIRNGTWTNSAAPSPVIPNAAARLECTNEPPTWSSIGVNPNGSAPTHTFSGTYTGFTPSTFQARLVNQDGTVAQDWTNLGSFSASAGNWSGTLTVPLGGPYRLHVRDATDTTKVWFGWRTWLCCVVIASMGQSPHVYLERIWKNGPTAVTGTAYVRSAMASGGAPIDQMFPATAANVGVGLARAINAYSAATGGKPLVVIFSAVTGTSSGQWATKDALVWPQFLTALGFPKAKRILLTWLNGAADGGIAAATIKANHDTILTNLDTDVTTGLGISYRYRVAPHNRDTASVVANNGKTRVAQYEWARDHAQFGSKVLLGPQWIDMHTDSEAQATAQAGAASTITLAATDEATTTLERNTATIVILSGTGAGQTRTISSYNVGTKVATVSVAWTTVPDATSVYRLYLPSPHPSNIGGVDRIGDRYGQDIAYHFGYSATTGRGPSPVAATYPNGGDGSIIDVAFTHRHGTALQTPNGATGATGLAGWEVSTDGGSTYALVSNAVIRDATTVRLTLGSVPANKANLRVRYGYNEPVPTASFGNVSAGGLGDLLYDNVNIGPTAGLPAEFTASVLTPTEAPPGAGGGVLATTGAFAA